MLKIKMQKLNINFSLRYSRTGKDKAALVCYVTVDGVRASPFSTGIQCLSNLWNGDKQEISGMDAENESLSNIKQHLRTIFNVMVNTGQAVSAEKIKEMYLQGTKPKKTLALFCSEWLKAKEDLLTSKLVTKTSMAMYTNNIKNLTKFLEHSHQQHLLLNDVDEKFANNFVQYLLTVPQRVFRGQTKIGFDAGYVEKLASFLKRLMKDAHRKKDAKENNLLYSKFRLEKEEKELVFLELLELKKLENYNFTSETSQRVVDLFIFQCYTGFAYSDIYQFDYQKHTIIGHDGKVWINKKRKKNEDKQVRTALLPFFKKAREIWEKYEGKMPKYSNNNYNHYFRDAIVPLGIDKYLTTHCGRKTAAMMFIENGCDFDSVAEMVGHANAKMTKKHYAKIRTQRIAEQLKGLEW
jgi:integrase/recombinase XerD